LIAMLEKMKKIYYLLRFELLGDRCPFCGRDLSKVKMSGTISYGDSYYHKHCPCGAKLEM